MRSLLTHATLFFMRPTKSKLKLLYFKKLRAIEKRQRLLEKQARESKEYVEIPRTLVGFKVCLTPIDSMRNKDEGLSEAIAASTSFLRFSDKPYSLCNFKSSRTIFDGDWRAWLDKTEKIEATFFKNKLYQKGKLELLDISEDTYKKLSPAAKKYFVQGVLKIDRYGQCVYVYHPHIPKSYLRESEEKLYWNQLAIPDSDALSESKRLSNWLNYKRQCELWHYEGYRTRSYYRCEGKDVRRRERYKLKSELRRLLEEYFRVEKENEDGDKSKEQL